jgi:flagellar biosynthesis GTPase FlhF
MNAWKITLQHGGLNLSLNETYLDQAIAKILSSAFAFNGWDTTELPAMFLKTLFSFTPFIGLEPILVLASPMERLRRHNLAGVAAAALLAEAWENILPPSPEQLAFIERERQRMVEDKELEAAKRERTSKQAKERRAAKTAAKLKAAELAAQQAHAEREKRAAEQMQREERKLENQKKRAAEKAARKKALSAYRVRAINGEEQQIAELEATLLKDIDPAIAGPEHVACLQNERPKMCTLADLKASGGLRCSRMCSGMHRETVARFNELGRACGWWGEFDPEDKP